MSFVSLRPISAFILSIALQVQRLHGVNAMRSLWCALRIAGGLREDA